MHSWGRTTPNHRLSKESPPVDMSVDTSRTISIVLAGGVGSRLHPLTEDRAKPAVPFGGKYRIIDFVLSNCLHSGLRQILVFTQYKSQSLCRHLRDGWSLFNPSIGEYLTVVPPQMRRGDNWYLGTADAVYQNLYLLRRSGAEQVMILSGDHIYRMDYAAMLESHQRTGASATVACMKVPLRDAREFGVMAVDENGCVRRFQEKPQRPEPMLDSPKHALASMGIYVFSIDHLCELLEQDAKNPNSSRDFGKDVLPALVEQGLLYGYTFGGKQGRVTADGYWRDVGTLDAYFEANMDLLEKVPPFDLYQKNWPIYSAVSQGPPARLTQDQWDSDMGCQNAMLGSGALIEPSSIRDSIVSRNVTVHRGAEVDRCILFDDVVVGEGVRLRKCIVEKGVSIPPGVTIGFDLSADAERFVVSEKGVVAVPRRATFRKARQTNYRDPAAGIVKRNVARVNS